jgi:DNA repair protein RadC
MDNTRIPTIKYWAEEERPRERFVTETGSNLSNAELIAILIGSGNADESALALAYRMLYSVDNDLQRFSNLTIQELSNFKGIGLAKAVTIAAAVELCYKRMSNSSASKYTPENSAENSHMIREELGDPEEDAYWVFVFNGAGMLQHKQKVGDQRSRFGEPREILQIALEHESTSIMLVHQSTVVNNKPNKEDLSYTLQLIESANMLSMVILDRIIIHKEGHYSYRNNGHLTDKDS